MFINLIRVRCMNMVRNLSGKRQLVVLGSAHKVGSTWLNQLLTDCCGYKPYSVPQKVIDRYPQALQVDLDLCDILQDIQLPMGWYIFKTHSFPPPEKLAAGIHSSIKFVTMVRDPRDILISSSSYLANLPEELGGWGEKFRNLGKRERIIHLIENAAFLRTRLRDWYRCQYAYKIHYELLLSNPVSELQGLLAFLGIEVSGVTVRLLNKINSFESQSGRKKGKEDEKAFLRKGIAGDWRNYFDDEVKRTFKQSCGGEWNDLLVEMGYEKNIEW